MPPIVDQSVATDSFNFRLGVTLLAGLLATSVARYFWQLALLRHYLWIVSGASVLAYAFLFFWYLKDFWGVLGAREFVITQALVLLAAWSWFDVAFQIVDCGLDRSPAVEMTAKVVNFHERKNAYYLVLSASPELDQVEMQVASKTYSSAMANNRVQIAMHAGALGAPWCGRNAIRAIALKD